MDLGDFVADGATRPAFESGNVVDAGNLREIDIGLRGGFVVGME